MPTENRSSNTEMVSVPRDKLQAWQERFSKAQIFRESSEVQALLSQPSDQHQGEPVALPAKRPRRMNDQRDDAYDNGWNNCLDEIAKLGPLYTRPEPAVQQEPVARLRCYQSAIGPKVEVIKFTAQVFKPGREVDVYIHADPGEVERLQFELSEARAIANGQTSLRKEEAEDWAKERDTLRAQLAEVYGLLRDLGVEPDDVSDMYSGVAKDAERYRLLRERMLVSDFPPPHPDWSIPSEIESKRIDELCDAALSASAEPELNP
ncbi:hypothetical protein HU751_023145 [Pseudomonas sp. BW13M1]|uniref:Uncharacterized protein n=1 Tax=Pseudomonas peradeniyensis TaxID=2745488 RepID=A0A923G9W7_9PSED|nr:hypothetical protein [Pseudomonas peradeniyensis]MBV4507732.1 hypothetical protein [Pseudomonas peradeniyensis]